MSATLTRMVHAAVTASDTNGGNLSPVKAGQALRGAFPNLSDEEAWRAIYSAAEYRGRTLPA